MFGYAQEPITDANIRTATDQDGNSFEWISYGSQDWAIENAEVVTYRDGTPIPQVTDDDEWFRLTTGAWCYYDNDSSNSKLYNAYAIIGKHDVDPNTPNKEFAPEGWNVPTNENWGSLLSSIGMEYSLFSLPYGQMSDGNEGSKLSGSENLWFNNPNNCSGGLTGTDGSLIDNSEFSSSGFNWTPEGYRSGGWSAQNPSFCLINEWGFLWSITSNGGYLYSLSVTHNLTGISKTIGVNTYGRNARFVRDISTASTECSTLVINTGVLSTNPVTYNSTVNIYSNPANDQITIDCGNLDNVDGWHIKITNMLGQEVFSQPMNTQQYVIPLNTWTGQGMYFVKIINAQNEVVNIKKIVLQ
jgi:uncharacterized protein (TIGR02145 family)